jgi:hypothetical protein
MIDEIPNIIETFSGDENQARCFNHVVALVAKSTVRQFDVPKGLANAALDEAERELQELAEGIDIEDKQTQDEWEGPDDEGGEGDDVEGWVDEVACLSVADRVELEENIKPVKLVLVKVSFYFASTV